MPSALAITIDISNAPKLQWDGDTPGVRRDVNFLVEAPEFVATDATMYIRYRGELVAQAVNWTPDAGDIRASSTFNTVQLVSAFAGRGPSAVLSLTVEFYVDNALYASGTLPCLSNPPEGYDPPSDVGGYTPMYREEYDADADGMIDSEHIPPAGAAEGVANIQRETFTLDAGHMDKKAVTLGLVPDGSMYQVQIHGGSSPVYGDDFVVFPATKQLSWEGLHLDGLLEVGDKLVVEYTYTVDAEPPEPSPFPPLPHAESHFAGADDEITPGDIGAEVEGAAAAVSASLAAHAGSTENPHQTTPQQIGAVSEGDSRLNNERVPTAAGIASKVHVEAPKDTPADLDEIPLVDSAADWALKHLTWAKLKSAVWPTADGTALDDANRFGVGQESGGVWTWVAKTGTQLKAYLKDYFDGLYCALSNFTNVLNVASDYLHGVRAGDLSVTSFAFDDSSHVLTITDPYIYWFRGVARSVSANNACDLDDYTLAEGLWFLYHDDTSGTLKATQTPWAVDDTKVFIACVHWNGSAGIVVPEYHKARRDIEWHEWAHTTVGARITSPTAFAMVAPSGGSYNTVDFSGGTIKDEDISIDAGQQTNCRTWRQTGAGAYTWAASTTPFWWSGAAVEYIRSDTYARTALTGGQRCNYWFYAATEAGSGRRHIYSVAETVANGAHANAAAARAVNPPVLAGMGLSSEWKLLYRVIFGATGFVEATDYRASSSLPSGGLGTITASSVLFTPAGDLSAATVQAMGEELDDEKEPRRLRVTIVGDDDITASFSSHDIIKMTVSGNTVALPAAGGATGGKFILDIACSGTISVAPVSGTIMGDSTAVLTGPCSCTVYDDGTEWRIR